MPITIHELRAALDEQAEAGGVAAPERFDGVRRRVAARRRRHTALVAAGLAAVVVAVVALGAGAIRPRPVHPVPPANPTINGLPDYADGGKQLASTRVRVAPGTTRLFTITPSSYGLTIAAGCSDGDETAAWTILVNGHPGLSSHCTSGASPAQGSTSGGEVGAAAYWNGQGVRLGRSSQISVNVSDSPGVPHRAGVLTVAVYQEVPLADYPFPRAPGHLGTPELTIDAADTILTPLPAGLPTAVGTFTSTAPYRSDLEIAGATTAPGLIIVLVDGTPIDGHASWDYNDGSFEIGLAPSTLRAAGVTVPKAGAPLTITLRVSRFATPSWRVWVTHPSF